TDDDCRTCATGAQGRLENKRASHARIVMPAAATRNPLCASPAGQRADLSQYGVDFFREIHDSGGDTRVRDLVRRAVRADLLLLQASGHFLWREARDLEARDAGRQLRVAGRVQCQAADGRGALSEPTVQLADAGRDVI